MPADLDDLLARADRVELDDLPTRADIIAELETALHDLEREFPDGRRSVADGVRKSLVRYEMLLLTISSARFAVDECGRGVSWVDESRPELAVIQGGRDDA